MDLTSGSAEQAEASYRELRSAGWQADPVARLRLKLFAKAPFATWTLEDLLGVFSLLAMVVAYALIPLLVIAPIHYLGLWRFYRIGQRSEPRRWGLREAYCALVAITVCDLLAVYMKLYAEVAAWFQDDEALVEHSLSSIEHSSTLSGLCLAVVVLVATRHEDWKELVHVQKLEAPFRTAFLALLALRVLNQLNYFFLGQSLDDVATPYAALSQEAAVNAIYQGQGVAGVAFFIVLLPAVFEEFLFRGVLLEAIRAHTNSWIATLAQALVFASLHDESHFIAIFGMGCVFARVRLRTGGLLPSISLHMLNNALATLVIINRAAL